MMKDLLWAESQKLHRSKILWIAGFATVMVGLIVFAQGQFTFYDRRYIDGAGWFMTAAQSLATFYVLPAVILLNPCAEYQRLLRMGKVEKIAANFSEYIANEPKVSYRDGRYFVFDGQNTIEARKTCNGGRDLPIRCKVFYGLSKEHEALLFAVQTGISSELTAGEQLRAKLVAHEENACDFVSVTEDTGVRFALDGIRAPWKIYCIRSAYYIYKSYGTALYHEMLSVLVDAWGGDSDSFLSGILHGMARFLALYQGEYSRERLILRLRTVHPKTITRLAQNDTGNVADRHMKQILSIYNGAGRTHNLPCKR